VTSDWSVVDVIVIQYDVDSASRKHRLRSAGYVVYQVSALRGAGLAERMHDTDGSSLQCVCCASSFIRSYYDYAAS